MPLTGSRFVVMLDPAPRTITHIAGAGMTVIPFGKRRVALPQPAMARLQALARRYDVTAEEILEHLVMRLLESRYEELEDIAAQLTATDWTVERPRFPVAAKVIDLAERRPRRDPERVRRLLERARNARESAACAVSHSVLARELGRTAVAHARLTRATYGCRRAA
ncbi:MAG TPA: hypothetical protein VGL09_17970 [Methylomirabilota bacterium]|jgi:hypothetical protein